MLKPKATHMPRRQSSNRTITGLTMNALRQLALTSLHLLCATLVAWADGPVWEISKGASRLFVGGTVHLLSQADYPLPEAFDQAYGQVSRVVFETDIDEVQTPEFQQKMLKQMLLNDGQTLQDVLQPATLQAVAEFARLRGMPMASLENFRPSMLVIMLTAIEMQRLGLAGIGVDQFYLQRAKVDRKGLGQLESVDEQLAFLLNMGSGQEDAMILHSLEELDELPALLQSIKVAWRQGDNATLARVALEPWKIEFPAVYDAMLVQRNRAWLTQIEALLQSLEVELVLVGTLHLVGEDGILSQLAARGYRVEPL